MSDKIKQKIASIDTLQEVGQWMIDNQHVFSILEDAIMASNPNDTSTQEFLLVHGELGVVSGMVQTAIIAAKSAIDRTEELKAKYKIE